MKFVSPDGPILRAGAFWTNVRMRNHPSHHPSESPLMLEEVCRQKKQVLKLSLHPLAHTGIDDD